MKNRILYGLFMVYAGLNARYYVSDDEEFRKAFNSILSQTATFESIAQFARYIPDINYQYQGSLILNFAIHNGSDEGIVKILLKNGANPFLTDRNGKTAFDVLENITSDDPGFPRWKKSVKDLLDQKKIELDERAQQIEQDKRERARQIFKYIDELNEDEIKKIINLNLLDVIRESENKKSRKKPLGSAYQIFDLRKQEGAREEDLEKIKRIKEIISDAVQGVFKD